MRRALVTSLFTAGVLLSCSASSEDTLSQADADAFASQLMVEVQSSGVADTGIQSLRPGLGVDTSTLAPLASCSPQKLTPVRPCASGGNIYTTINTSCPDASIGQCCAANPPCSTWTGSFGGQQKTLYNGCKPSPSVMFDGSINGTMSGSITGNCAGIASLVFDVRFNGSFTARVNGRDACPDGVSLTLHGSVYDHVDLILSGNFCGRQVLVTSKGPPAVQCNGFGCPAGTYCGKCDSHCYPTSYPVDCCSFACPSGTTCTADNRCKIGP